MVGAIRAARGSAERLAGARDRQVALAALRDLKLPGGKPGNATNWPAAALAEARAVLGEVRDGVAAFLDDARAAALGRVLGALAAFTLAYARERRALGGATFSDLLTWARDLLRDHADARAEARARFSHVFVDEFQDTDPLQAEIVWYLTAAADGPPGARWDELVPSPGKLFVVGDPKQSIYRFRRADLGVYQRVYDGFGDEGRLSLRVNFRSVPPVLRWANHHFAAHLLPVPGVQPPYTPLEPRVDEPADGGHRVHSVGGPVDGKAEDVWLAEAAAIASVARRAVEEEWLVRDRDGKTRKAHYGDICVLLPTRTNVRRLERAMREQDVPYRVDSGSLILATQEVRDLLACLRAIDDPSDQVALVAALRSPAYACSDVDLLTWVEAGGRLDYGAAWPDGAAEAAADAPLGRVAAGLGSLKALHAARVDRSAAATIDALVRERMLAVQAFGRERPREAWRRIRYVAARARALAAAGRPSLRALVDWLEDLQRAEFRDVEEVQRLEARHPDEATPDPEEQAVRFMTVHGAKGLEFPIVLLSGLGNKGRFVAPSVIVDRGTGQLHVRAGTKSGGGYFKTPGYDAAETTEKDIDAAERVRLLYVAATRARDHLVLCLYRGDKDCPAAEIATGLAAPNGRPDEPPLHRELTLGPVAASERPEPGVEATQTPEEHRAAEEAWCAERAARIQRLAAAPLVATRALGRAASGQVAGAPARLIAAEAPEEDNEVLAAASDPELAPFVPPGRGATGLGRAVHAALRAIDLDAPQERAALIAAAARANGVADRLDVVGRMVAAVLASEPARRATAARRRWREVPLGARVDGVAIEGQVDLLYQEDDRRLALVDFETDPVDRATALGRAVTYRVRGGAPARWRSNRRPG